MNSHEINSDSYVEPILYAADKLVILNLCKMRPMGLIQNYQYLLELRNVISSNLLLEGMGEFSGDLRRRWLFSSQL